MKTTIISAICTPLDEEESLHVEGLEAHLEEQWAAGIRSVLVGGSMGCLQLLRDDTYRQLVRHSVEFSKGRGELIVGVGDAGFARTQERIRMVHELAIDGVLVLDPYLFQYTQAELIDYYRSLADISHKPVYLYYVPGMTGAELALETVVSLSKHPNIQGIKCSVDFSWTRQLIQMVDSTFRVIVAQLMLLDVLIRAGVHEHLDGLYAVFPRWAMGIAEAAERGDWACAAQRQATLSEFARTIRSRYSVFPACTAILNARGVPGNIAPAPMRPLDPQRCEQLLEEPVVKQIQQDIIPTPPIPPHGVFVGRPMGSRVFKKKEDLTER